MISIYVYERDPANNMVGVDIETTHYDVYDQVSMIHLIKALMDKVCYAGETICLEKVVFKKEFIEINRWK